MKYNRVQLSKNFKRIAVISYTIEHFKNWIYENYNPNEYVIKIMSNREVIINDSIICYGISNRYHARSLTFDEIMETDIAYQNNEYDKIIEICKLNLKPLKK